MTIGKNNLFAFKWNPLLDWMDSELKKQKKRMRKEKEKEGKEWKEGIEEGKRNRRGEMS